VEESQKFWYLFIAYSLIWLLIGGYIVWLGVRQRRNRRQIDQLSARLGHPDDRPGGGPPRTTR